MSTIISIGSGVTEVTTAYALACRGYSVTIFDRQRYPAMDTSFAKWRPIVGKQCRSLE
ncbi:glycine/D-amino acid oxidase-like deaminating enzyme [Bradyrhizobium sp. LM3.2]